MKLSTEQGGALFKDREHFASCPVHSIAVAVFMQMLPSQHLLDHIPMKSVAEQEIADNEMSLLEILPDFRHDHTATNSGTAPKPAKRAKKNPGVHTHISRLLMRLTFQVATDGTRVTQSRTSHSFRRGGAQSTNADAKLSTRWVLDRGVGASPV